MPDRSASLGADLRGRLERAIRATLDVTGHRELLEENPVLQRSIHVRNPVRRSDQSRAGRGAAAVARLATADRARLRDAFVVTVNGIAAGMRNAGWQSGRYATFAPRSRSSSPSSDRWHRHGFSQ